MRKILLMGTGGTIACLPSSSGLAPSLSAQELLCFINRQDMGIDCRDLFAMDSSNIQPEEWKTIAREINLAVGQYDGIVLTHGTDTMAYTASMLSFMLRGIPIPVVMTGSQHPIAFPDSDGRGNLSDAFAAAEELPGGVYICFGGDIMLGCRAVKVRTTSRKAFESINAPYTGVVANGRFLLLTPPKARDAAFSFQDNIDSRVALIKLVPGTSPALFHALPACGYRAVVVEAFGLGGMHSIRRVHTQALLELQAGGMPVVISSQCLYEHSTTSVYEVSSGLEGSGIISSGDMTTEAAVTKLMWVLGQTQELASVKRWMLQDLCGEIANG